MSSGVIPIGNWQLAVAALFMVVAAVASFKFKLGLTKDILISTLRVFLQLLALGIVLRYLFEFQTWWLVLVMFVFMIVCAVFIARGRVKKGPRGLELSLFLSLAVTSVTVTAIVVGSTRGAMRYSHSQRWVRRRVRLPKAQLPLQSVRGLSPRLPTWQRRASSSSQA